jgi:pimeloyl-ACP methyl ester carboxylesterase
MATTPIVMLPGLAANQMLFKPQIASFPNWIIPEWIPPLKHETLEHYAQRFSEKLHIDPNHPYILGGFSFGGQIAQEMVQHLPHKPSELLLICGVRGRHQYSPSFIIQEQLTRPIPSWILKNFYTQYAGYFAKKNQLPKNDTLSLINMAKAVNPDFFKWSVSACAQWNGKPDLEGITITHIHGQNDNIIPDTHNQATHTIPHAKHLITLTHANDVNSIIQQRINAITQNHTEQVI